MARPSGYSTHWPRPASAHRRLRNSRKENNNNNNNNNNNDNSNDDESNDDDNVNVHMYD